MIEPQRQEIDDRIVEAALLLITEHGLNGVSMTDIAQTAGVARQTLYNRYPNVDSIIAAVIQLHGSEGVRQLQALIDTAPTATRQLAIIVEYSLATTAQDHDPTALRSGLSPIARQAVDTYNARIQNVVERVITNGIDTDELRPPTDPRTAATIVLAMVNGATQLDKPSANDIDAVTTMILQALGSTRP